MLSTFEVVIYSFSFALLPLAIYALATGSQPPRHSGLRKYYSAEKYLGPLGNLMLIALSGSSLAKLAANFGFIPRPSSDSGGLIDAPFLILLVVYGVLWIKAITKVRRAREQTHA